MQTITIRRQDFSTLSAELLTKNGSFSFCATGNSMAPAIRSGDLLTVEPHLNEVLEAGDIVLYRTNDNRLIAHRIILVHLTGPGIIYDTKGDAHDAPGETIPQNQILGKVTQIKHVNHLPGDIRKFLAALLLKGQRLKMYRFFARNIVRRNISFHIIDDQGSASFPNLYRHHSHNAITQISSQIKNLDKHTRILFAFSGKQQVAELTLCRFPDDPLRYPDWWIVGMNVRTLFRGCGVGHGLLQALKKYAEEKGIEAVHLLVAENNLPALALYSNFGFQSTSIPQLENELLQDIKLGCTPRRILTKKIPLKTF